MSSYILLALFIIGAKAVITKFDEFFDLDLDWHYKYRNVSDCRITEQRKFIRFLMRPTIMCNVCMTSFWGTIGFFLLFQGFNWQLWLFHLFVAAALVWTYNLFFD